MCASTSVTLSTHMTSTAFEDLCQSECLLQVCLYSVACRNLNWPWQGRVTVAPWQAPLSTRPPALLSLCLCHAPENHSGKWVTAFLPCLLGQVRVHVWLSQIVYVASTAKQNMHTKTKQTNKTDPKLYTLWNLSRQIIIIMEICKAPTLQLKALNKHTHIMYIKMENVIQKINMDIYIYKGAETMQKPVLRRL